MVRKPIASWTLSGPLDSYDIVELGMARRPQFKLGGKAELGAACDIGGDGLLDRRFGDFNRDRLRCGTSR